MWPEAAGYSAYREPTVPAELIRYTCGHDDYESYLRSGYEVASMFDLAVSKTFGRRIDEYDKVLDFGCGAGRLARFMHPRELFGCDVNAAVVDFCTETISRGRFDRNDLLPPLPYADETFELVYAFSVFSHLRQDIEEAWLAELVRVGARGCIYLLTVHGDWVIEQTLGVEAEAARRAGFHFRSVHTRHGSSLDFPDYYEASYHTADWIRDHWGNHFDVVDVISGDDPGRYLPDGAVFEPSVDGPPLRPMGQDLVIGRKR
jgi:SAM-dependent methyltransferase